MSDFFEEEQTFTIEDDHQADWALRTIKKDMAEHDRLVEIAKAEISALQTQIESLDAEYSRKTSFLKAALRDYYEKLSDDVKKDTKTQKTYKLLSGSLVYKKASEKMTHDDTKLVEFLEANGMDEFLKKETKVQWAELKKNLVVLDGKVVDANTGLEVDGVGTEIVPESFDIK